MRRGTRRWSLATGFFIVLTSLPLAGPTAAASSELFFSEYIEGSSNNKALEIYNDTGAALNLGAAGYNVQMFFNGSTSATLTINLTGSVADDDVYVLAQSQAEAAILDHADQTNGAGWFNGDDAVVLRRGTTVLDVIGVIGSDPGTEWGTGHTSTADNTLRRKATVTAGDTNGSDAFDPAAEWNGFPTNDSAGLGAHPGLRPLPPTPEQDCTADYTHTYEIQGDGPATTMTGTVTTQGVVVGDFEGGAALQGVFIQDVSGDDDAATSDGLFIFTGSADNGLAVGDLVRATGTVGEFSNQTQISNASVTDCGTAALPALADVTLPVAQTAFLERYEGMRVRFPQALVIAEYFNYERFGELVLARPLPGEDRAYTPTLLEQPGSPGYAERLSLNLRSRITLDDGLGSQNPPALRHPNGMPFSLDNRFRGGDTVTNAVGVLNYSFGLYRIQPTAPADYAAINARPAAPAPVGGTLQVAAFNTLNFFLTADESGGAGDNVCGGNGDLECRGYDADQPSEFDRQRDKLLAAIAGLDAEVIGLNEMENTPGVNPLGDPDRGIVAGLNEMFGAGTYDYIDTGVIGTDAIRVGMIYKPGSVTPVGDFEILDSTDDPRFDDSRSRPVLAQTFRENATGALFTVAVNHLKSKGSACNGDPDLGDGSGNCNVTRTLAARALVDWLASDPTGSGDPDYLIIGDLNSYAMEDPIDAVRAGADDALGTGDDYTNLIALYGGRYAYSYVFDGMAGYLDHALSTNSLTAQITGATEWHINADEPDVLDYDTSFKPPAQDALYEPNAYRSSDHDPVLVGLGLTPDAGRVTGTGSWTDGSFDISAQFLPGASDPTGSTTLVVPEGTLVSTGYDWLTVSGKRATFQGTGTLDGAAGYGFLVSVLDNGSPGTKDRIRVRVWDSTGETVYDSQSGAAVSANPTAPLTAGNLVVHKAR